MYCMSNCMQGILSLLLRAFQSPQGSKHLIMLINQYVNNIVQGTLGRDLGNDHYRVKQDRSLKNYNGARLTKGNLKHMSSWNKTISGINRKKIEGVLTHQEDGLGSVGGTRLGIDYMVRWPS